MRARRPPRVRASWRSTRPLHAPVSQMRHINPLACRKVVIRSHASLSRVWLRASRHVLRARRLGLRQVLEEDAERVEIVLRKARWRLTHDCRPAAIPVHVVGRQRSGTTMLLDALKRSPVTKVHNESPDSAAFARYALRDDAIVRELVVRSRSRAVVFKPLLDSHRVLELLDDLGTPTRGRAVWIYRAMEGSVRSSTAKWPDEARRTLGAIADGRTDLWQAGGLSAERLRLVRELVGGGLNEESASALVWYLRNSLVFDLGLPGRPDVAIIAYEDLVRDPERRLRSLCAFIGIPYDRHMAKGISHRPPARDGVLAIDPEVARRCEELHERLNAVAWARTP
jgi:hypothetical protein